MVKVTRLLITLFMITVTKMGWYGASGPTELVLIIHILKH